MISNYFDLYFPLLQFDDNDYKTKEIPGLETNSSQLVTD